MLAIQSRMLWIVCVTLLVQCTAGFRYINIGNPTKTPIWIQTEGNGVFHELINEKFVQIPQINPSERLKFRVDDDGWDGVIWPKTECDVSGNNCKSGQSIRPCPLGGCAPPQTANTKVHFYFPPSQQSGLQSFYEVDLEDGYSMSVKVAPYKNEKKLQDGSCNQIDCHLTFDGCPRDERSGLGDLRAKGDGNNVIGCYSPCRKYISPAPWGPGKNALDGEGRGLCCNVSQEECRNGIVVKTEYVKYVHRACDTSHAYKYDDNQQHKCPADVNYNVDFYS